MRTFKIFLIGLLVCLAGFYAATLTFSLLYSLWWIGVVLHFVGGFWAACLFYELARKKNIDSSVFWWMVLIGASASFGIVVELVQYAMYVLNIPIIAMKANLPGALEDTLADLLFDMTGGTFAAYFLLWKRKII